VSKGKKNGDDGTDVLTGMLLSNNVSEQVIRYDVIMELIRTKTARPHEQAEPIVRYIIDGLAGGGTQ
jgi:hypothetical protein